jgi:FkbM family methyltransferase
MDTAMNFYSQFGEDKWIADNLSLPTNGVFVEVGADDGVTGSNTKHLEERGWTGLCIEPDPRQIDKLRASRSCQISTCAIGPDPDAVFHLDGYPSLSGFLRSGGDIKVPVMTLGELLKETGIGKIDVLSIDTEGTEIDVWRSFDHEKHQPGIVIAEFNTSGMAPKDNELLDELNRGPYRVAHRTFANYIFERLGA